MSFGAIATGWALVTGWFLAFEATLSRLEPARNRRWLRGPVWIYLGEAFVLTLLAALWFGSLGHGGWVLVFVLLGLIAEWPLRFRAGQRGAPTRRAAALAVGVGRIVVAGGLLAWRLS